MPFERRSDVQVLEYDRSERLLQRRAAIACVLDAALRLSNKLAACKTLAIRLPCPFYFTFLLSVPSVLCRGSTGSTTAVCRRGLSKSEVSIAACVLAVQQVTHCTRERIEDNIFGGRRKEPQLRAAI